MSDDAPVASNETPAAVSAPTDLEPAADILPAPDPDVRHIVVSLSTAAIDALRIRRFLAPGEDGDVAIADAMMSMLDSAWKAGVHAGVPPPDAEAEERRKFLNRLAAVNA